MCWNQPVLSRDQNLASKTKQPFYWGILDGSAYGVCLCVCVFVCVCVRTEFK